MASIRVLLFRRYSLTAERIVGFHNPANSLSKFEYVDS